MPFLHIQCSLPHCLNAVRYVGGRSDPAATTVTNQSDIFSNFSGRCRVAALQHFKDGAARCRTVDDDYSPSDRHYLPLYLLERQSPQKNPHERTVLFAETMHCSGRPCDGGEPGQLTTTLDQG